MKLKTLLFAIAMTITPQFALAGGLQTAAAIVSVSEQVQAQEAPAPDHPAPEQPEISDDTFYQSAIKAVLEIMTIVKKEGVSTVVIALSCLLIVAQLLIQLTKTALFGRIFTKVDGTGKLMIVSICTVVTTLVPMLLSGVPVITALTSGAVFNAIMIAGHQIYKHLTEKKA